MAVNELSSLAPPEGIDTVQFAAIAARIDSLDLEPIIYKLLHPDDGHAWTLEEADRFAFHYKLFLALILLYPEQTIVPTKSIDQFWHAHILDTQKYRADCEFVFGRFLDHFPYFGLRGEEDAKELARAGEATRKLFSLFGPRNDEPPRGCGASCGTSLCEPNHCDSNACAPYRGPFPQQRPRPERSNPVVKQE